MKETSQHTAGPWHADSFGVVTGGANSLTSVCETYAHAWAKQKANLPLDKEETAAWLEKLWIEAQANAQLIAAAPELLAACEFAVAELGLESDGDSTGFYDPALNALRAAIAKAQGGGK